MRKVIIGKNKVFKIEKIWKQNLEGQEQELVKCLHIGYMVTLHIALQKRYSNISLYVPHFVLGLPQKNKGKCSF